MGLDSEVAVFNVSKAADVAMIGAGEAGDEPTAALPRRVADGLGGGGAHELAVGLNAKLLADGLNENGLRAGGGGGAGA